jgi:2,4-dichlorophenol 6-monooxygenase
MSHSTAQKYDIEVPVLIVGGGPAGLVSSLLLSRYGIKSLLINKHSGLPMALALTLPISVR